MSTLNTDIVMNLYADFAAACARELQAAGYTSPAGTDADIIRAYANVRHRRVSVHPRTVHKASYAVPSALVAGEQAFLAAVTAGHDLRPYQSTRLETHDFNDGMLNDFGIQHFHLGIGPHRNKPGFKDRTEPVLVAIVRDDDFYSLGCHPHGAWAQQSLLDLAHATWPTLLAPSAPHDPQAQVAFTATDADIEQLRRAGINPITQRSDRTIHASPGGGSMSNRGSANAARDVTRIKGLCNDWERKIKSQVSPMLTSGTLVGPVTLHLEHRGADTFVVGPNDTPKIKLGRNLVVPPL